MTDATRTTEIQRWIERLASGDQSARDRLLHCAQDQLLRVTRKILRDFPAVHRWEQTEDVFQNAALRLYRALEKVELEDGRHFFRLAALQIRRELIDMARRYQGPQGLGAHHASQLGSPNASASPFEPSEHSLAPQRLAEWAEFHRCVEELPDEEREVFDLLWYHSLSQEEAAALLNVTARTIKRRWRAARLALHERLGGEQPGR